MRTPLAFPRQKVLTVFQVIAITGLIGKHPLDADALVSIVLPPPSDCWLLLAANLEPLPASLSH